MAWGFGETARRHLSFSALLAEVRDRIDAQVLAEPAAPERPFASERPG